MKNKKEILSSKAINELISLDSKFKSIIDAYGLPDNWSRPQGFQTLCKIILEQQVSLESAKSAWNKLEDRLGEITPLSVRQLDLGAMKQCYVSRQKATYLHALADAVISKLISFEQLPKKSALVVEEELKQIKGIGPWTAQVYMIFALRFPDIYPPGDVALNNAVKKLWNVSDKHDIYTLTEKWSPYRTTASFLLWHQYLSERGRVWVD